MRLCPLRELCPRFERLSLSKASFTRVCSQGESVRAILGEWDLCGLRGSLRLLSPSSACRDSGSASGGSVDDPDVSPPTTQDVGPQTTCSDTVLSRKVVLKGTSA